MTDKFITQVVKFSQVTRKEHRLVNQARNTTQARVLRYGLAYNNFQGKIIRLCTWVLPRKKSVDTHVSTTSSSSRSMVHMYRIYSKWAYFSILELAFSAILGLDLGGLLGRLDLRVSSDRFLGATGVLQTRCKSKDNLMLCGLVDLSTLHKK